MAQQIGIPASSPMDVISKSMTDQYGSPLRALQRHELWKLLSWHDIPYKVDCTRDQAITIAESQDRKWPEGWMPGPPPGWRVGDPCPGGVVPEIVSRETDLEDLNIQALRTKVKDAGLEQSPTDNAEALREKLRKNVNEDVS